MLSFSIFSVLGTVAAGILLAVILEWRELRFRKLYRTLLILPYAVPGILSILILRGLFSQEFGAVNQLLKTVLGFAPAWETDPWPASAMFLLIHVWLGCHYLLLISYAMLHTTLPTLYEPATFVGASQL